MGQIYSFFGYGKTVNNHYQREILDETYSCEICFEVLHDPVQCQNNEHYFCRKCIAKHLENCPLCKDTLELKKPRCRHVSRGCTENVEVEDVSLHEQTCGYAPVVCSNEGCKETVNRCDQESHETEECKFRKITCESCKEELVYIDYYKKHPCSLKLRKEIDEIKSRLDEITEILKQSVSTGPLHQPKVADNKECGTSYKQSHRQETRPRTNSTAICGEKSTLKGQIYIFGGGYSDETGKSVEVFNWSTKTWTLKKNCLFSRRYLSYSFIYGKKITICGGISTERIEYLNPSENGYTANVASMVLPSNARHNGLLYKDRILAFENGVIETSLDTQGESRTLLKEEKRRSNSAGVHLFEDNVYIVGGEQSKMENYDAAKNEMKTLPSLPYKVSDMATVSYKDNIIIIGGYDGKDCLDDVVMFNVTTQEYKKLPSMLKKRRFCTAVIMDDVIVVMGGSSKTHLNTVEYHVIGDNEWKKLPAMNLARSGATACVYA